MIIFSRCSWAFRTYTVCSANEFCLCLIVISVSAEPVELSIYRYSYMILLPHVALAKVFDVLSVRCSVKLEICVKIRNEIAHKCSKKHFSGFLKHFMPSGVAALLRHLELAVLVTFFNWPVLCFRRASRRCQYLKWLNFFAGCRLIFIR